MLQAFRRFTANLVVSVVRRFRNMNGLECFGHLSVVLLVAAVFFSIQWSNSSGDRHSINLKVCSMIIICSFFQSSPNAVALKSQAIAKAIAKTMESESCESSVFCIFFRFFQKHHFQQYARGELANSFFQKKTNRENWTEYL